MCLCLFTQYVVHFLILALTFSIIFILLHTLPRSATQTFEIFTNSVPSANYHCLSSHRCHQRVSVKRFPALVLLFCCSTIEIKIVQSSYIITQYNCTTLFIKDKSTILIFSLTHALQSREMHWLLGRERGRNTHFYHLLLYLLQHLPKIF